MKTPHQARAPEVLDARRAMTFEQLAELPDDAIDIGLGAALIARDVYPHIDVDRTVARFDELAFPLLSRELSQRSLRAQAQHLSHHLYEECGFSGNESDYYDPKNSLICDVLDRKLGIPISLAVVYCEVSRRLGVNARGVSFPGHFLVRLEQVGCVPIFVDPFAGGRVLERDDLERLHLRATGRTGPVVPELLLPARPRMILYRMLVNLRSIHLSRGDIARAMLVIDRILSLTPDAPEPLRERGLLSARLGALGQAVSDLERFLELAPEAIDASQIRERVAELRAKGLTTN